MDMKFLGDDENFLFYLFLVF